MNKILITGAGGYIGSVATYLLLQQNYEVVAVDNFTRGYKAPLELLSKKYGKQQFRFYQHDLNFDIEEVFKEEPGISAVIHYAAFCLVDESMKKPELYFSNNVNGSHNLLQAMVAHSVPKIIFSSTCAVYGEAQNVPVTENEPTKPINPYGESKLMVEKILAWYQKLKGLEYVVLRYFNVCGASDDGLIGDSKKPSTLLMQNAVRGALDIEPFALTCPNVNTPDKTPIRDYVNVVDLNEAHISALKYLEKGGKSDTFNLGTGTGNSVLEIVNKVQEVTGKRFELNTATPRQGEYKEVYAKIDKARSLLGWSPKRTLEQSVKSLVTWYNSRPKGWER